MLVLPFIWDPRGVTCPGPYLCIFRMRMGIIPTAEGCYEEQVKPFIYLTPSRQSTNECEECEHWVMKSGTGKHSSVIQLWELLFYYNLLSDLFSVGCVCMRAHIRGEQRLMLGGLL